MNINPAYIASTIIAAGATTLVQVAAAIPASASDADVDSIMSAAARYL